MSVKNILRTFRHDISYNRSIIILTFIVLLIICPVITSVATSSETDYGFMISYSDLTPERIDRIADNLTEVISCVSRYICLAVSPFAAILLSGTLLGYMRKKQSTDLFHAFPVKREEYMTGHILAGLVIFILPLFVCFLLNPVVFSAAGGTQFVSFADAMSASLVSFFDVAFWYVIFFALATLTVVLTSTFMSTLCLYLLINFGPILAALFTSLMGSSAIGTNIEEHLMVNLSFLINITPYVRLWTTLEYPMAWYDIVIALAVSMLIFALAVFLYKKRKSENCTASIAFRPMRWPVQYMVMFLGTMAVGLLFYAFSDGVFYTVAGCIIGALLSYIIMNMIFGSSFRHIFDKPKHLISFSVIFILFFLVFCADIFSIYDSVAIPRKSDIEYIRVEIYNLNDISLYRKEYENGDVDEYRKQNYIVNGKVAEEDYDAALELYRQLRENRLEDGVYWLEDRKDELRIYITVSLKYESLYTQGYLGKNDTELLKAYDDFLAALADNPQIFGNNDEEDKYIAYNGYHAVTIEDIIETEVGIIGSSDGPTSITVFEKD